MDIFPGTFLSVGDRPPRLFPLGSFSFSSADLEEGYVGRQLSASKMGTKKNGKSLLLAFGLVDPEKMQVFYICVAADERRTV
jgi:hypothetical protein